MAQDNPPWGEERIADGRLVTLEFRVLPGTVHMPYGLFILTTIWEQLL